MISSTLLSSYSNTDDESSWLCNEAEGSPRRGGEPMQTYRREIARLTGEFNLQNLTSGHGSTRCMASKNEGSSPTHRGRSGSFARSSRVRGCGVPDDLTRSSSSIHMSQVNAFLEQGWDGRVTLEQYGGVGRQLPSACRSPSINR